MKAVKLATCLSASLIFLSCGNNNQIEFSTFPKGTKPVVLDNRNVRRFHVSTRPHNRKLIYHQASGYWFVFYGHGGQDPDGKNRISWRSSKDGITWSKRHTAYEGNSHSSSVDVLITENRITTLVFRPYFHLEKAGLPEILEGKRWYERFGDDFPLPYEIYQHEIMDGNLISGQIFTCMEGSAYTGFPHYGSLTQDSLGFYWVAARVGKIKSKEPMRVSVARSSVANDISKWESAEHLFQAIGKGTVAPQIVSLDDGKVFTVIFSKSDVKVFGTLYDPLTNKWQRPYVIAPGNDKSKRAVACFDPGTRRLHLVNIDNKGSLRHKILKAPYTQGDWLPGAGDKVEGTLIVSDVISKPSSDNNFSLSIDASKNPALLAVAYHKKTPHYHIRWYDGKNWEKQDYPIGIINGKRVVDEISMVRDFSNKFGLIYYLHPQRNGAGGELHFLEIHKNEIITGNGNNKDL